MPDVLSIGEPLIGVYTSKEMPLKTERSFKRVWGGDTSNTITAVSKLGYDTGYITKIGDDQFGESFMELWEDEGVDTNQIQIDNKNSTGLYFATYQGKDHEFIYYREGSAASTIEPDDLDKTQIKSAKLLHTSGISQAISESSRETVFEALNIASKKDITVSYDVNFRAPLWSQEYARAIINYTIDKYVDLLELTGEEVALFEELDPSKPKEVLDYFLSKGVELVALKKGGSGCYIGTKKQQKKLPPETVEVADTIGAGDAFDAGLIAGYLKDLKIDEIGRIANYMGGVTCQEFGPLASQPRKRKVERKIESF